MPTATLTQPLPRFMTTLEVMQALGLNRYQLMKLVTSGQLEAHKLHGKYLFNPSNVEVYKHEHAR